MDDTKEAVGKWLDAAPDGVKEMLASSVVFRNFFHDQRNECFQMTGKYDGAMSKECTARFREQYEICAAVVEKMDEWYSLPTP